jgi:hypothetical protein
LIHLHDFADPSTSNNTTIIQDLMNKAVVMNTPLFIDSGQWKHTGLTIPTGLVMLGNGKSSELYNTSATTHLDCTGKIDFVLRDFGMRGTATVDNSLAYPTVSNTGTAIKLSACDGFDVSNIFMTNIGTGIDYQANGNFGAKGRFYNIDMEYMYKGIYTSNSGEYATFHSVNMDKVTFGIHSDSGNNMYDACQVVRSGVAVKLTGGTNNGHGQMTGCTFNHNNYAIDTADISLGETFSGCHFIGDVTTPGNAGRIRLINSKGINFVGCQIGCNITIDGGTGTQNGQNAINSSVIRVELPNYVAPSILNGGLGSFKNNSTLSGMWASNN